MQYNAEYTRNYDNYPVRPLSDVRWNFIQSALDLPVGSHVLDVGYGNGAFLKRARHAGMLISGIDLHGEDFNVPEASFHDVVEYDLVTFFDSLEHFSDFAPILALKARHVIVSLPLTPGFLLASPLHWRHYKPGEHLHYFSPDSLDTFMRAWGFPRKILAGYPEDMIRGRLSIAHQTLDNIYTSIYTTHAYVAV